MRFFSPDKLWHKMPGGTLIKYGKYFSLDAGRYGYHLHTIVSGATHIPVIPFVVGLIEYLKEGND